MDPKWRGYFSQQKLSVPYHFSKGPCYFFLSYKRPLSIGPVGCGAITTYSHQLADKNDVFKFMSLHDMSIIKEIKGDVKNQP